jgi:hypothetical protein
LEKNCIKISLKIIPKKSGELIAKNIGKDWADQRIKGLSLSTAIKFALFPNSKKKAKNFS